MEALTELPCTYDQTPIRALQGTVELKACFTGRSFSTTVYVAGPPCQSLIGRDLINGLGLSIQGKNGTRSAVEGPLSAISCSFSCTPVLNSFSSSDELKQKSPFVQEQPPPISHPEKMQAIDTGHERTGRSEVGSVVESPDLTDFPVLTQNRLGSFPHFQHRIQLHPDAIPVEKCMRPILYALREGVEDAVRELDNQGYGSPVRRANGDT